jgi:hypothetical protein
MLETLEGLMKQWQKSPNLDLPAISHGRYSRRALTGKLVDIALP